MITEGLGVNASDDATRTSPDEDAAVSSERRLAVDGGEPFGAQKHD